MSSHCQGQRPAIADGDPILHGALMEMAGDDVIHEVHDEENAPDEEGVACDDVVRCEVQRGRHQEADAAQEDRIVKVAEVLTLWNESQGAPDDGPHPEHEDEDLHIVHQLAGAVRDDEFAPGEEELFGDDELEASFDLWRQAIETADDVLQERCNRQAQSRRHIHARTHTSTPNAHTGTHTHRRTQTQAHCVPHTDTHMHT